MGTMSDKFTSVIEVDEDTAGILDLVADKFTQLAEELDEILPESREKSLTITNLQQAHSWANRAVTDNEG